MATQTVVYQVPPLQQGAFTAEQQRILNDILLQLSRDMSTSGAPALTMTTASVATTDMTVQVPVEMASADYFPLVMASWNAGHIWVIAQTARLLQLGIANAPFAVGASLRILLVTP